MSLEVFTKLRFQYREIGFRVANALLSKDSGVKREWPEKVGCGFEFVTW